MKTFETILLENTTSTSEVLKREYHQYKDMTFLGALYQSQGRGRMGHSWESKKGENILFSLLIKDEKLCKNFASLSILSAVSLIKVLNSMQITNTFLKWPNDVIVNNKKIAGILLDGVSDETGLVAVIIGIGINTLQNEFKGEYKIQPTSIKMECQHDIELEETRNKFYNQIYEDIIAFKNGDSSYIKIAKQLDYLKGKRMLANLVSEIKEVDVLGINDDNSLRIKIEDEIKDITSGEITFIK